AIKLYIDSYQEAAILTTGELWALAILLRIGLLENLTRLIRGVQKEDAIRKEADAFVTKLIESGEVSSFGESPENLKQKKPISFWLELLARLRDSGAGVEQALHSIQGLIENRYSSTLEELIRNRHRELAAAEISIRNIVLSLRLLASVNWA